MPVKIPRRAVELLKTQEGRQAFDESNEVAAFCRLIGAARKHIGMSQDELELISGVPQAEISRIESGMLSRGPTLLTLVRLARAMNLRLRIQFESKEANERDVTHVVSHATAPSKAQLQDFGAIEEISLPPLRRVVRRTEEA